MSDYKCRIAHFEDVTYEDKYGTECYKREAVECGGVLECVDDTPGISSTYVCDKCFSVTMAMDDV